MRVSLIVSIARFSVFLLVFNYIFSCAVEHEITNAPAPTTNTGGTSQGQGQGQGQGNGGQGGQTTNVITPTTAWSTAAPMYTGNVLLTLLICKYCYCLNKKKRPFKIQSNQINF
jgi:hypothetical protein